MDISETEKLKLYNADCMEVLPTLASESVDCVMMDPPYKYLEHKLEVDFDEEKLVKELVRLLKPKGFVVTFGRGESFYRLNTLFAQAGLKFKEEVVWNKVRTTSPALPLGRIHETISIFAKGNRKVNKCYIPRIDYLKTRPNGFETLQEDVRRIRCYLEEENVRPEVLEFLRSGEYDKSRSRVGKNSVTFAGGYSIPSFVRAVGMYKKGNVERSIIEESFSVYKRVHPTEKPVSLMTRLLNLTTSEGDLVLDPFMGSSPIGKACLLGGRKYVGIELYPDYYKTALARLEEKGGNQ